jgi:hypothetical protein
MNGDDRELRFRQRIDQLIDRVADRDATIAELRRRLKRRTNRIYQLTKSRELERIRRKR